MRAVNILVKALPASNNPELSDNDFGDFIYAPYAEYVAKNGCTEEYLHLLLHVLYEMTQRFSAEDAIRSFLNAFPGETLKEFLKWSKDEHYHVQRLCSEGTHPKLPWSQKINIHAAASLPILDNLFSDKTRFVTRSGANHINDISKIDPRLAIDTLVEWRKSEKQESKEMKYIIGHALRTLVKQGNKDAMQLLGVSHQPRVRMVNFKVPTIVKWILPSNFLLTLRPRRTPASLPTTSSISKINQEN